MEDENKDKNKNYQRAFPIPLPLNDLDILVNQALSLVQIQVFYSFDRSVTASNQITYRIRSNSSMNKIGEIRLFVLNGKTIFFYPPRQDVSLPNDLFDGSYSFEEGREDGKRVLKINGPGFDRLNEEHYQFIFMFMDELQKLTGQLILEDDIPVSEETLLPKEQPEVNENTPKSNKEF